MFHFSPRVFLMLAVAPGLCLSASSQRLPQATSVSMSTTPRSNHTTTIPNAGWQESLPERLISAQVHDGILTIDGMVAKVQLNYEIQRAGYMYFFVPGVGTAVVSLAPMEDSDRVRNAIHGSVLSFDAGEDRCLCPAGSVDGCCGPISADGFREQRRISLCMAAFGACGEGSRCPPGGATTASCECTAGDRSVCRCRSGVQAVGQDW
jgi:hypothetical protein